MTDQIEPRPALDVSSCLVIGGARSGKSGYAQRLAEGSGRTLIYCATAAIWDAEMQERVTLHQAVRDARWRTVEEQVALPEVLARTAAPDTLIVVDCLTLWLSNLVLGPHDVSAAIDRLADTIPQLPGRVIFVSNEVGGGIVPDNALARRFRDEQGRLNQTVARVVEAVVLVAAGLPLLLKPGRGPILAM